MTDQSTSETYHISGCPQCGRLWAFNPYNDRRKPVMPIGEQVGLCTGQGRRPGESEPGLHHDDTLMFIVDIVERSSPWCEEDIYGEGPVTKFVDAETRARLWATAKLFASVRSGSDP